MADVRKISYWQPVALVDGVPQCPHCAEPMVDSASDPGDWRCPLAQAWLEVVSDLDLGLYVTGHLPAAFASDNTGQET